MPNRLENSLPQAAKPDAVYGMKKMTMMTAEISRSRLLLSRKRLWKKSGRVMALQTWV